MIRARVHPDDHAIEVPFDATPWFEQASDEEIMELVGCDWGGDYPADRVAMHMADEAHPEVAAVFRYVEIAQNVRDVGFECYVEEADAVAWLRQHRPHLANAAAEHGEG